MVSKTAVQALIEENEAHKKTIASLRAESDAKNKLYLRLSRKYKILCESLERYAEAQEGPRPPEMK